MLYLSPAVKLKIYIKWKYRKIYIDICVYLLFSRETTTLISLGLEDFVSFSCSIGMGDSKPEMA